jgi:small-conductance mechanosensitive channel
MLPNLVVALLIMIVFYVAGRLMRRVVTNLLGRVTRNRSVISLLESIVGISIVLIGFFIALGVLKLDDAVTSLLAGAGIIGLALGFAFQNIASNFIAGVVLSVRHPFGVGDIIQSNDYFGTVEQLNLRSTILSTPTGQIVFIPNKMVFENPLENFTKNGQRRIELKCGVSYGDDLEKARKVAIEAVEGLNNYDSSRNVELYYCEFGDSSVNFMIRFWIQYRKQQDYWTACSEAVMAIKKAFDEHDIMIPFPIRTLDFGIRGGQDLGAMLNGSLPKNQKTS